MEFTPFQKIPRLNRECVITEKIDGTNAQIVIVAASDPVYVDMAKWSPETCNKLVASKDGDVMFAGSRTRYITPEDDNFGFARWVKEHADELWALGPGRHFGEWWGSGIQRGYGLPKGEKRFSLFNTSKWTDERPNCCGVVPMLYQGPFNTPAIEFTLHDLRVHGSRVAPFMNPEGIVVFHTAGGYLFKVTLEGDEKPKGRP